MTLVGRAAEVARMQAALGRLDEPPWMLEVRGEPGIGKTRLLAELTRRARDHGFLVLTGQSTEQVQETPYGAIGQALDGHVQNADLTRAQRAALEVVCPHGTVPAPVDSYRVDRAVRAALETLAKASGLVLVLDDLHWADDATLGLVAHLLRHPPVAPILMVVAYRPAQVPARVTAAIDHATSVGRVDRIELAPLSVDEVAELLGADTSRSRAETLHRRSGGNPFYLGLLTRDGDTSLADEINRLSPLTREVARAAAVAGEDFEPGLVAAVVDGVSTRETLAALDDLLARDLVRVERDERRLRFRHPLVRDAAYLGGDDEWRVAAHRRVAVELANRHAPAVVRADHIALSAAKGDLDAVRTLVRAATVRMPEDPAAAARWLRVARNLLPPGETALRQQVITMAGQAFALNGDLTESSEALGEALAEITDPQSRVDTAVQYATVARLLGRYTDARTTLRTELDTAPEGINTARIKLELTLINVVRGEIDHETDLIDDVLASARRSRDALLEACARTARAWSLYMAGDVARANHSCDTAKALLDGVPDGELASWIEPVFWLSQAERFLDRFDDSLRHADRGIALARATGRNFVLTSLLSQRALLLRWLGRFDDASRAAADATEVARLIHSDARLGAALQMWSRIRLLAGDPADAVHLAEQAVGTGGEPDWWQRNARKSLLLALTETDRVDRMADVLAILGGPELATIVPANRPLDYEELVRADLTTGNLARAREWAEAAERFARPELPSRIGLAHLAWAQVAATEGDHVTARQRARDAVVAFGRQGNQFEVARAYLVGGRAAATAGDSADAISQLERAAALFTTCAAPNMAAQAVRELRQLGRRSAGSATLTPREQEIADLVAGGATNRQIAEKLVISERTVGTHLSRIYAKLGISSRAALAAQRTKGDER
jgi:DNA-binding NarL/FixJ family response regulator